VKKAVNQWCFPEGTPLSTVIEESARAGFWGIELNLQDTGEAGVTLASTCADMTTIRKQMLDAGIQPSCLSTALLWTAPLSSADRALRERGRQVVLKQVEMASALEVDVILVVPGVVRESDDYEECYRRSQDELARLADVAQTAGVRIGVENVWNKFLLSALEMKRFVEEIHHPALGVYFDVGNVLQYGYPQQWIHALKSLIWKVHVKDFVVAVGSGQGFVPLLAGNVNWPAVMQAFRDIGYDDVLTAEISPYASSPYQAVRDTSQQMEEILKM